MRFESIPFVHPGVLEMSRHARAFGVSLEGCCAPSAQAGAGAGKCCGPEVVAVDPEGAAGLGSGSFGVKRPLRFLAYKLSLTEAQVSALAAILDDLKIERAQAAVDDRRTLSAFAEAMSGDGFDAAKAAEGSRLRQQSAERLGAAVAKALGRIHQLLTREQRDRFAYLIRTGTILL